MILPAVFVPVLLISLLLLISFRINIVFIAKDTGITYTIKGDLLKVIKVFEIKSGRDEREKKNWQINQKEKGVLRARFLGLINQAIQEQRGKIFHIEKLSIDGTFSIEDAAANAVLYGLFLILWQFVLIFLAKNFKLEHQYYNFLPDFQNDKNELIFQAIFRVVIFKMLLLVAHNLIATVKKKPSNLE
ncbi:MAG: hypothetical protein GX144_05395 [Clostridiaceae bacterium]|nr:hypothetical protein [Clostridiaceae bacterium]